MAQYYVFTGDNSAFFTPKDSDFQPAPAHADPAQTALWTKEPDGTYTQVQGGAGWHLDPSKGLAFQVGPDGQKSYGSPYGPSPSSMEGTFINQQWNPQTGQYEGTPNWNTIGSLAAAGGIGLGAASAAGAFGAGGAAAGGGSATAAETGAPVLEGLAAGPGAATLPAAGTAAVLPSAAIPGTAGIAGGGIGAIAPGVAASSAVPVALAGGAAGGGGGGGAASPSLWSKIATIGGIGVPIAGALIQAHQQGEATDAQVAAAKAALDFQKQVYNERKTGLQPYSLAGAGAINRLGSLWGFNMTPPVTSPASAVPLNGQPLTASAVGSRPNPAAGGSVASLAGAPGAPNRPPPQVGETRNINGQSGQWDGQGWVAV